MKASSIFWWALCAGSAVAQSGPIVTVGNGKLQGTKCPTTPVNGFFSIPYATAPLGALRFAPPQPFNQTFNGTRDASTPAPACPQFSGPSAEWTPQSEDCLFVDVWAPANATKDSKLPVKVFLYGGNNLAGGISNPLYNGCFASTDVIQVSINYRVGPLGFLAVDSLGLTGNYGILDQLLALQWVQDNIAAFGGDPAQVLLFGQSAGADDALALSSLPQAAGKLFHAAVLESGDYYVLPSLSDASSAYMSFMAALDCTTVACLRAASLDALNATAIAMPDLTTLILDGTIISAQPLTMGPSVPAIVGTLANEGALSLLAQYQAEAFTLTQADYDSWLLSYFNSSALAARINATYPVAHFAGAPYPVFAAMTAVLTDSAFRCPAHRVLEAAATASVPVYTYLFNHTLSCAWVPQIPDLAIVLQILGSAHTAELPFVFGEVVDLPAPSGTCNFTTAEIAISEQIRAAWDAMAAGASPGGDWPLWTPGESKGVIVAGDQWLIGTVDYSMCGFWDGIGTTNTTKNTTTTTSSGGGASTTPIMTTTVVNGVTLTVPCPGSGSTAMGAGAGGMVSMVTVTGAGAGPTATGAGMGGASSTASSTGKPVVVVSAASSRGMDVTVIGALLGAALGIVLTGYTL